MTRRASNTARSESSSLRSEHDREHAGTSDYIDAIKYCRPTPSVIMTRREFDIDRSVSYSLLCYHVEDGIRYRSICIVFPPLLSLRGGNSISIDLYRIEQRI